MSPSVSLDLQDRFDEIARRLDVEYGPRVLREGGDPVSQLIGTILSQSTSDVNSSRAMERLRDDFPTWDQVMDADVGDVRDSIKSGGLANQKAPRIQAALHSIVDERGLLDLDFLRRMNPEEALDWLVALDGVGPKTAACVLLFSLGMPVMPVDTHVGRVMTRLGIVEDRTSTLTKQRALEALVGDDAQAMYAVHVETIQHGRRVCLSQRPRCGSCFLNDLCDYAQERDA